MRRAPINVIAALAATFVAAAMPAGDSSAAGRVVEGRARIIDGATLDVLGTVVALDGISAPQNRERGGYESTRALAMLIAANGSRVWCDLNMERKHGRSSGTCRAGGRFGPDLQATMVEAGWAVSCPRSDVRYAPLETVAVAKQRGVWALGVRRPVACAR